MCIIAELIQEAGGQAAIARIAGVSQPAVHKWVAQTSKPGPSPTIRLALHFNIPPYRIRPDIYPDPDWMPDGAGAIA